MKAWKTYTAAFMGMVVVGAVHAESGFESGAAVVVSAPEAQVATTAPQRYRCIRERRNLFGKTAQSEYVTVSLVDLGEFWLWRSDKPCGTITLDVAPFKHDTATSMLFPKRITNGAGWRNMLVAQYAGEGPYVSETINARYHVVPKRLGSVMELRIDVKYDLHRAGNGANTIVGERITVVYGVDGRLVSLNTDASRTDNQDAKYSLLDCRDPASQCDAP
ncbi:MAG: hypothetical protein QM803_07880 [Rhodocyclaceae bacterium]